MKSKCSMDIDMDTDDEFLLNTYMSSTLPITNPETPNTSLSVSSKLKLEVPTPSQPVNSTHFKRDLQPEFTKAKRGKRSHYTKKCRRQQFRNFKKKEKWKNMKEMSMIKCWKERATAYYCGIEADKEEEETRKMIEKQTKDELSTEALLNESKRIEAAEKLDKLYEQEYSVHNTSLQVHHNTKPLLLDAVLIPEVEEPPTTFNYSRRLLEAQKERDIALLVARQWRDIAENIQAEKRDMKTEMERTVETVRNFWRNKVVEGSSRSGKILRAALVRK